MRFGRGLLAAAGRAAVSPRRAMHVAAPLPSVAGRRRFYRVVGVEAAPLGFRVLLDGRVLKTPQRRPLVLPSEALALAVAAEWDAQTDPRRGIQPAAMPLTTLATTALDLVAADPKAVCRTCLGYLATDSALFLAPAEEPALLRRQEELLGPFVRWAEREFEIRLGVSRGSHRRIEHPKETVARLAGVVGGMDVLALACLQSATAESKSLLVALALLFRAADLEACLAAARLEEEFQIGLWGAVEGGHDLDRLNSAVALSGVDAFLRLLMDEKQHGQAADRWRQPAEKPMS